MATRREKVILTLQDDFTSKMTAAALATAALRHELDAMDEHIELSIDEAEYTKAVRRARRATADLRKELGQFGEGTGSVHVGLGTVGDDLDDLGRRANRGGAGIDRLSGRLRILRDIALATGPALVPLGGIAIAGIAGLANQLGIATLAAGTSIIAFQGVGDALDALNTARLDPTVENLVAAHEALETLSPAAQDLAQQLSSLSDEWAGLKAVAAEALLPGVSEALTSLEARIPDVQRIVGRINEAAGDLVADAGANLASEEWDQFFDFLATEGVGTLTSLGHTVGNLTRGFTELWMAFGPLNASFDEWAENASAGFAEWADGLAQTEGFQEFVDYIRQNGPQVADTLASIGNAFIEITEAAAPLGGATLRILEAIFNAISAIADSSFGTPLIAAFAALATFNRAVQLNTALMGTAFGARAKANILGTVSALTAVTTAQDRARASAGAMIATEQSRRAAMLKSGAAIAGLGLVVSGAADKMGLANTASLALMGSLGGPWGAAIGAAAGAFLDLASAGDDAAAAIRRAHSATLDFERRGPEATGVQEVIDQLEVLRQLRTDIESSESFGTFLRSIPGVGKIPGVESRNETLAGINSEITSLEELQDEWGREAQTRRANIAAAVAHNSAILSTAEALETAQATAVEFANSLTSLNGVLSNRAGLREYEAAIDALSDSMGESGSFSAGIEAGRKNLANMDAIAAIALKRATQLKDQGKDLAAVRVLQRAITDLETFASKSPAAKEAAQGLLDLLKELAGTKAEPTVGEKGAKETKGKLRDIDKTLRDLDKLWANPLVTADVDQATGGLDAVLGRLAQVQDKDVTVRIFQKMFPAPKAPPYIAAPEGADGLTVPGQRHPYRDKVFAYVAPGEEIISNRYGQADRHRALLKAINAGRYADGGTVLGAPLTAEFRLASTIKGLIREFGSLTKALKGVTRELDKERAKRDEIRSKMDTLKTAVGEKFNTNPFEITNPWAPGAGDWKSIFKNDIAGLRDESRAIKTLKSKGLDGDALAALLSQADPATVQQFAAMSKKDIRQYERLFEQRAALQSSVGAFASSAAFGSELRAVQREIRESKRELRQIQAALKKANKHHEENPRKTGQEVGKAVNGAAAKGRRNQR